MKDYKITGAYHLNNKPFKFKNSKGVEYSLGDFVIAKGKKLPYTGRIVRGEIIKIIGDLVTIKLETNTLPVISEIPISSFNFEYMNGPPPLIPPNLTVAPIAPVENTPLSLLEYVNNGERTEPLDGGRRRRRKTKKYKKTRKSRK
jgi:hypothetical protein